MTAEEVGRWVVEQWRRRGRPDEALVLCRQYEEASAEELRLRSQRRELSDDVDPHDLEQTGWGVVFSQNEDPAVRSALQRLLDHRREQVGRRFPKRYQEVTYRGESAEAFLWYRHREAPGLVDPDNLPYYLLLVGSPDQIPFDFQYQVGVNRAVGRLDLPKAADYISYVKNVIAAEDYGTELPREAVVFSVNNDDDTTLPLLSKYLVEPIRKELEGYADWKVRVRPPEQAYKRDLARLLGGGETPGLLLASCHGKRMPYDHPHQKDWQGALLCQDWPGPVKCLEAGPEHFFHAGDLPKGTDLGGLVAFLFACYGAGTPRFDNFPHEHGDGEAPPAPADLVLAPNPFTARLPQAMLRQGALGVVGHVDRGWTLSFHWEIANDTGTDSRQEAERRDIVASRSLLEALKWLLKGHRLGHSLRPLLRRSSNLAAHLTHPMERVLNGQKVDYEEVGRQWTAHNDARNLILLGDPAVYLLGQQCWRGPVDDLKKERSGQRGDSHGGTTGGSSGVLGEAGRGVQLAEDLLHAAEAEAQEAGLSVEEWLSQVVRERLRK